MTTYFPPKKGVAYVTYISLISQANTKIMQANPTIAAGDFKVAIDDGAPANFATLPVVDADFTKRVKIELSAGEMNGDNITLICSDAAGAEWCDLTINLQTTARQIDDLAYPTVSGRSLDVTTTGAAGIDWANVENPTTALNLSATNIDADQMVASVTAGVTVTTNNDKTGYSLSAAAIQAIWDALTAALTTANSIGKLLVDNVNTTISSRSSHTAADVWAVATRVLTAGTNIVLAKGAGVTGFNDLSAAQVNSEVLDVLTVDTFAEVTSAPAATSSLEDKIGWLFKLARNLRKTTSTTDSVYNDAGTVVDSTSAVSDDTVTFTRGEYS